MTRHGMALLSMWAFLCLGMSLVFTVAGIALRSLAAFGTGLATACAMFVIFGTVVVIASREDWT